MIKQTITQAALLPTETFDGTKSKCEALTESIENASQILDQKTLHIGFFKMTGSPLSSTNTLKAQSPNLMWMELKRKLSMQYSVILSDSHATQAFAQLEQDPSELLDMHFQHTSALLSKYLPYIRYV